MLFRLDPLSLNIEFNSKTGGAEFKLLLSNESGGKSLVTSVSGKKLLVTGFIGSIQYTVSPEVYESEVPIVTYLNMIPLLFYYSGNCFRVIRYNF